MIPQIRKILFTSDLSETSKHAFSYALSLAGHYRAQMVFLFVMEEINVNLNAFLAPELMEPIRNQFSTEARITLTGKRREMAMIRSQLQEFCNIALKDFDQSNELAEESEVLVAEGNVVDTIVQTSEEKRCDAIVLGSRRRSALSEVMHGSVVRGVLRRSNCLVIVAPPLPEFK